MEKIEEKVAKVTKKADEIVDARLVYEVSYLLLPMLDETQVTTQVAEMKSAVEKAGGALISDENPVLVDLAYSMTKVVGTTRHKCTAGHFGWMKFDVPMGEIAMVKKAMDANDAVLRYLLIKTVRENTLLNGKMNIKKEDKKMGGLLSDDTMTEVAEAEPTSPEEIDKSIDSLVIA